MGKRKLAVGLIGYRFMGKAHSNAWRQAPRFFDLPVDVELHSICGRDARDLKRAAGQLGWNHHCTDWRRVVDDPAIDIVDICTPNDSHAIIAIAAARAGKAILCEKPLARNVREARRMVDAVKKTRVVNMVCHNYRRIPAIALAKEMIERGELGDRIYHFRARYAQDWIAHPDFPMNWRLESGVAGSGALGDIFSHIVDLARYLVGEFSEISGMTETFVKDRPLAGRDRRSRRRVKVDDAVTAIGRFKNGALASLEATRFAQGRKNALAFEINGSGGSLVFDLEDLNRLKFYDARGPENRRGFRDIIVTEPTHPYIKNWWPPGHIVGYEHTFIHTVADFVKAAAAVSDRRKSTGATVGDRRYNQPDFSDALKTQEVLEAINAVL